MITPRPITLESFDPYGRVVEHPSGAPTAQDPTFRYWSDLAAYHIDGDTEIGVCTVFRQTPSQVTWMERHDRTPELLIPIDAPFLLPVMEADGDADVFRVNPGEAVIIGRGVWHSACHPVGAEKATYFVIFRRGTPAEDVIKKDVEFEIVEVSEK